MSDDMYCSNYSKTAATMYRVRNGSNTAITCEYPPLDRLVSTPRCMSSLHVPPAGKPSSGLRWTRATISLTRRPSTVSTGASCPPGSGPARAPPGEQRSPRRMSSMTLTMTPPTDPCPASSPRWATGCCCWFCVCAHPLSKEEQIFVAFFGCENADCVVG